MGLRMDGQQRNQLTWAILLPAVLCLRVPASQPTLPHPVYYDILFEDKSLGFRIAVSFSVVSQED
jgi:hypothetical protein